MILDGQGHVTTFPAGFRPNRKIRIADLDRGGPGWPEASRDLPAAAAA
jgi:hypothetical protein